MKKSFLFVLSMFLFSTLIAQDEGSSRSGKWMLETGSSLFSGLTSSSGGSVLFDEGFTVTQLGLDIGKFVSDDFAWKVRAGILDLDGESIGNLSVGGKYYLGGVAPIEANAGMFFGGGDSEFILDALIGYAIVLADNIYFEPKGGIIYSNSDVAGIIKFSFAMLF